MTLGLLIFLLAIVAALGFHAGMKLRDYEMQRQCNECMTRQVKRIAKLTGVKK